MIKNTVERKSSYVTFEFDLADMRPFFGPDLNALIDRVMVSPPSHVNYPFFFDLNASWSGHDDLDNLKIFGSSVEGSYGDHSLIGYMYDEKKYPSYLEALRAQDYQRTTLTGFLMELLPEEYRQKNFSVIIRKKYTDDNFPHPIFLFEEAMDHPIFTPENVKSGEFEPTSYDDWDWERYGSPY